MVMSSWWETEEVHRGPREGSRMLGGVAIGIVYSSLEGAVDRSLSLQ